jgi:hypothetical protein
VRLDTHGGMQAEAVDVGAQRLARPVLAGRALQAGLTACGVLLQDPFRLLQDREPEALFK